MEKNIFLVSIIIATLFLSGCYTMTIEHHIDRDGSAEMSITYDLSSAIEMTRSMTQGMGNDTKTMTYESFAKTCENISLNDDILEDVTCTTTEDFKMMISGKIPAEKNTGFRKEGGYYIYDAKNMYKHSPQLDSDEDGGESGISENTISDGSISEMQGAKMLGLKLTYVLTMPGEIVESTIGKIDGNTVTIDIFEMPDEEEVIVKAKASIFSNVTYIIGASIIVLGIIAFLIYLEVHHRKKKAPPLEKYDKEKKNNKK